MGDKFSVSGPPPPLIVSFCHFGGPTVGGPSATICLHNYLKHKQTDTQPKCEQFLCKRRQIKFLHIKSRMDIGFARSPFPSQGKKNETGDHLAKYLMKICAFPRHTTLALSFDCNYITPARRTITGIAYTPRCAKDICQSNVCGLFMHWPGRFHYFKINKDLHKLIASSRFPSPIYY